MTRTRILIGTVAALVALSGCGSRPSEDVLAQSILNAANGAASTVSVSPDQARCIARGLLASPLSDTTLAGLARDFDHPQVLESEADQVEPAVSKVAQQCSTNPTSTSTTASG
jgi:hypothetical protein